MISTFIITDNVSDGEIEIAIPDYYVDETELLKDLKDRYGSEFDKIPFYLTKFTKEDAKKYLERIIRDPDINGDLQDDDIKELIFNDYIGNDVRLSRKMNEISGRMRNKNRVEQLSRLAKKNQLSDNFLLRIYLLIPYDLVPRYIADSQIYLDELTKQNHVDPGLYRRYYNDYFPQNPNFFTSLLGKFLDSNYHQCKNSLTGKVENKYYVYDERYPVYMELKSKDFTVNITPVMIVVDDYVYKLTTFIIDENSYYLSVFKKFLARKSHADMDIEVRMFWLPVAINILFGQYLRAK